MNRQFQVQNKLERIDYPMDKLTQTLAKFTPDEHAEAVGDKNASRLKEFKKRGKPIVTEYWLKHEDGYSDLTPLNWFDIAVLAVCSAHYKQDKVVSFDMIHRALTGSQRPANVKQRKTIRDSIIRMMKTIITIDMSAVCKVNQTYANGLKEKEWEGYRRTAPILPCEIREGVKLNGRKTDVVKILAESPLMDVAEAKNQLQTVGTNLLAAPELNNTHRVLIVKVFVVLFVVRMVDGLRKGRKGTPTSLTFETIYEIAGVDDDTNSKRHVREATVETIDWLKVQGVIRDFKLKKDGNRYHSIELDAGIYPLLEECTATTKSSLTKKL